jgi:hypothetical protein
MAHRGFLVSLLLERDAPRDELGGQAGSDGPTDET